MSPHDVHIKHSPCTSHSPHASKQTKFLLQKNLSFIHFSSTAHSALLFSRFRDRASYPTLFSPLLFAASLIRLFRHAGQKNAFGPASNTFPQSSQTSFAIHSTLPSRSNPMTHTHLLILFFIFPLPQCLFSIFTGPKHGFPKLSIYRRPCEITHYTRYNLGDWFSIRFSNM